MDSQVLPLSPKYPAHGTQAAHLLSALLMGQRINPLAGWRNLGIYRLADTAFQLRGLGWPVLTGALGVLNVFGEKCLVAEYHLATDIIAAVSDAGRQFAERELQLMAQSRRAA